MIRCADFVGSKILKNDRKPLFTVLWNLRVKSTQFLGNVNNKPGIYANFKHDFRLILVNSKHMLVNTTLRLVNKIPAAL